jgi:hypothetical protein
MLANKPMQKDVKAEMAAVAVTRSRLISWTHSAYPASFSQMGSLGRPGQTHVPPLSDTIDAVHGHQMRRVNGVAQLTYS